LSQLLEILCVWILIDGKVGLHGPELVVLEGGPHPFGPLRLLLLLLGPAPSVASPTPASVARTVVDHSFHRRQISSAATQEICPTKK